MQYYTTPSAHVADCAFYGGFSCGHTFCNCDVGILGDPGADKGGEGKSKGVENYIWNEEK